MRPSSTLLTTTGADCGRKFCRIFLDINPSIWGLLEYRTGVPYSFLLGYIQTRLFLYKLTSFDVYPNPKG